MSLVNFFNQAGSEFKDIISAYNEFTQNLQIEEAFKFDMKEFDDRYEIVYDLPGVEKADIKTTVEKGTLRVSASRKAAEDAELGKFKICERYHGSLSRSVTLPDDACTKSASATYVNGVLSITLPKIPRDPDSSSMITIS